MTKNQRNAVKTLNKALFAKAIEEDEYFNVIELIFNLPTYIPNNYEETYEDATKVIERIKGAL